MTIEEKLCLIMSSLEITGHKQREIFSAAEPSLLFSDFGGQTNKFAEILGGDSIRLRHSLNDEYLSGILEQCEKNSVRAVTFYSPDYPEKLKNIPDPPMTLYVRGNMGLLNERGIAVVGTRKVSSYGRRVTNAFTAELARRLVIVSGLAYGVDTAAHEAALSEGGKTVAVLGSGVMNVYPAANQNLAERILSSGGAVVSEFGLFGAPNNYHFPMRNRIVSGLADALLICEAPLRSGTMSTLEHALEQGKDVYAVPGEIYSPNSMGTNEILKRLQGALVTEPKDILDNFGINYEKTEKTQIQLDFSEQLVVNLLSRGKMHFDELVAETALKPHELAFVLANLELKGLLVKLPGNNYQYMEEN